MRRVRRWDRPASPRWLLGWLVVILVVAAVVATVFDRGAGPPSVKVPPRFIACPVPPVKYVRGADGLPRVAGRQPPKPGSFDARRLLRLRYADAEQLALRHGCTVREVEGPHHYAVADDRQGNRVNLALNDDEYVIRIVDVS